MWMRMVAHARTARRTVIVRSAAVAALRSAVAVALSPVTRPPVAISSASACRYLANRREEQASQSVPLRCQVAPALTGCSPRGGELGAGLLEPRVEHWRRHGVVLGDSAPRHALDPGFDCLGGGSMPCCATVPAARGDGRRPPPAGQSTTLRWAATSGTRSRPCRSTPAERPRPRRPRSARCRVGGGHPSSSPTTAARTHAD